MNKNEFEELLVVLEGGPRETLEAHLAFLVEVGSCRLELKENALWEAAIKINVGVQNMVLTISTECVHRTAMEAIEDLLDRIIISMSKWNELTGGTL